MRKTILVAVSLVIVAYTPLFSQESNAFNDQSLFSLMQLVEQPFNESLFSDKLNVPLLKKATVSSNNSTTIHTNSQAIPLVYAYKDLALFCKLEVKLEKVAKLPIKFRLGSVDYVDWLEGKRDQY